VELDAIVGAGAAVGGPYSPAVVTEGRVVFVAGQGAAARRRLRPRLDEDERRQTLENMGTLLEAGSGFEHVVRCGVWLVDLDDFPGMNGDGSSRAP
jgi:2-iminobutanoate/2-iminopropanoate deaminase